MLRLQLVAASPQLDALAPLAHRPSPARLQAALQGVPRAAAQPLRVRAQAVRAGRLQVFLQAQLAQAAWWLQALAALSPATRR